MTHNRSLPDNIKSISSGAVRPERRRAVAGVSPVSLWPERQGLKNQTGLGLTATILRYSPLALILLGFALRLSHLATESLWYDELLQLDIAQQPLREILPSLPSHAAVPLDYITSHLWILLGRQEYWVRLPAALLGTLALPLAYQLGRRLFDRATGWVVMLLLVLSPFHLHYSQEVRPYAWLILGVMLAAYGYWLLRRRWRWRDFILMQIGVIIFSLSHLFAVVIFGPWLIFAVVDVLFNNNRHRRPATKALLALVGSGAVALLILLLIGWGPTFIKVTTVTAKAALGIEVSAQEAKIDNNSSPPDVNWHFLRYEILTPLGAGGQEATLQLINGLAGLGLIYLIGRRRFKLALFVCLWLILPIVAIVGFLVHRNEFFATRYIFSTLPAYLLLVSAGLLALPRWLRCARPRWLSWAALLIIGGIVLLNFSDGLDRYYRINEKEDWRLVNRFLAQNAGPEDAIIAVNAESTLNWYRPDHYAPPDTFDDLANIQARVNRTERSWVIMSIFVEYMGEQADQIRAWLGEQGAVRLQLDPLIAVYYLGPTASPDQLLTEIQGFALPVDHRLYIGLARENRRRPAIAAQYFRLALESAPNEQRRAEYRAEMEALLRSGKN